MRRGRSESDLGTSPACRLSSRRQIEVLDSSRPVAAAVRERTRSNQPWQGDGPDDTLLWPIDLHTLKETETLV